MRVLVTGAGGFLGLNSVDRVLEAGHVCVAVDAVPLPLELAGRPDLVGASVDVRDRAAVARLLQEHAVDAIIHAAAVTLAPGSQLTSVETALDVNTVSTSIFLDEARAAGVRRFVYPSSTAVYGAALYEEAPVDEATPARPASVYGYSKLAAERLVVEAARSFGVSCVRVRITALFGPHERQSASRDLISLPYQLAQAARAGRAVRLPAGHARDWTPVGDVAGALVRLAVAEAPPHDLYTLGIGAPWDPRILAEALVVHWPDWSCGIGAADGSDCGLFFPDDPKLARQPLQATRFAADFGATMGTPARAAEAYAAWLAQQG